MIRVYLLPVEIVNSTEQVVGIDLIHDGLLYCTEAPGIRLLIMNTTTTEHNDLLSVANSFRDPTQEELDLFNAKVIITPPNPDILRAKELLTTSPDVITQPEMWELMRIFGRLHGIST